MERIKESNGTQQSKRIKEFLQGRKIEKKKKKKNACTFMLRFFNMAAYSCATPVRLKSDVAFSSFTRVQKKTIRKPKHNNMQSLSISRGKTRGFTAQGSVNKRLNQIELQKMKGKHEWGNEGADVVSDQITISTDYWRGKRLIELFYHTESLRLYPHTKPIPLPRWLVGKPHMWSKAVTVWGHSAQR